MASSQRQSLVDLEVPGRGRLEDLHGRLTLSEEGHEHLQLC